MSVLMQAPSGITSITVTSSGTLYTPNAAGQVNAQNADVPALLALGFAVVSGPASFLANFRNLLHGGDFSTNPWQRNIPGLASGGVIAAAVTNSVKYFSDRWFAVGGASSSILMAKVADTSIQGFSQSLKLSRSPANADTAAINFGQVIETADSIRAQNQQVTLSFWAKSGANYSGGALAVAVISGNGTDQSAANMVAASWTSQASSISGSLTLSSSMTRYSFTGNIPAAATQLGILLTFTPAGTAGSDDSITLNGLQLEIGGLTAFEHRPAQVELALCRRYATVIAEPASGVLVGVGSVSASNTEIWGVTVPRLRAAPAVTTAVGSFKSNSATAGIVAATSLAGNATSTADVLGLTATGTGTAGQAALLQGGGGSGYIAASADL